MIENAYGKINISLNITGIREDGYHLLDMIMVPIDLYDILEIDIAEKTTFTSNTPFGWDKGNLIYKAVEGMKKQFNIKDEFNIRLEKHIPAQAGLAGGSADAGAAIRILNRLCNLNLTDQQLIDFGVKIGADVPYCIFNKPSRIKGIGEQLEFFEMKKEYDVILVKPDQGISTVEAYKLSDKIGGEHPDIDKVVEAFINGTEIPLGNTLEKSAIALLPVIQEIKNDFISYGYDHPLMTGSGSTVFHLVDRNEDTDYLVSEMKKKYNFVVKISVNNRQ